MTPALITRRIAASLAGVLLACAHAHAQYPDKPIKLVVPYAAGGIVDSVARIYANKMSPALGKPLIVENRPGGAGKIAEDAVAAAAPDGYTILIDFVTRPTVMEAVTPGTPDIDMRAAFTTIGPLGLSPVIMNTSPSLGVADFASLVKKIKPAPGKFSYGSTGPGSPSHIVSEQIVRVAGLDVVHVPYRGGPAALNDLLAGILVWTVDTPSSSMSLIESRKVVPMFVINATRVKQLPDVPTLAEVGYPEMNDQTITIFMLVPAKTPDAVVKRLSEALMSAQVDSDVNARLDALALTPSQRTTLSAAKELVSQEIGAWEKAVRRITGR